MSPYEYSKLPPGSESIRLLRLLPSEDEAAPLRCKLCNYSLQGPSQPHIYEALSYVCGDPDITLPIYIDETDRNGSPENSLEVTTNLYAALSRLRDHNFERIMWVDAICIHQTSMEERRQQVQLMAKIYSSADRVTVWLGEQGKEMEEALEDIRLAANYEFVDESEENPEKNPRWQAIVLQEVAAARHVIMRCGSATIDGYAFCMGVKSLGLYHAGTSDLQPLPAVISLIEGAGLRSKHTASSKQRFTLGIRSLAELLDMFHIREASKSHDKVYALLGMSSDELEKGVLEPDYEISWEELFQKLIKFILGEHISLKASGQRAVIECKGGILGQVTEVTRDDRQRVKIVSRSRAWTGSNKVLHWTFEASANPIQEHDIICLVYGASKPTIIRLCEDHFSVVVVAATPLIESNSFDWPKIHQSMTEFFRDFLLVWDWESPPEEMLETLADFRQNLSSSEVELAQLGGDLREAIRVWNDIMILDDLSEYDEADQRLSKARIDFEAAFEREYPQTPESCVYCRTLLSWVAAKGYESNTRLLLEEFDPNIKDMLYGQTPLWAAATYGREAVVKLLLENPKVDPDATDIRDGTTPLWQAAANGHKAVVELLLNNSKVEPDAKDNIPNYGRTPLWKAAENGHTAIVKLLLDTGRVKPDRGFDKTPLWQAAANGHDAVVELLLNTGKVDADWKDKRHTTPLFVAVDNKHEAVVRLLLNTGKVNVNTRADSFRVTPLLVAIEGTQEAIVKMLLDTGKVDADQCNFDGQIALTVAARVGHKAIFELLLNSGLFEVDSKDEMGRTPLWEAAAHGHEAIVKLLLATGKVDPLLADDYGRIPYTIALMNHYTAVAELLLPNDEWFREDEIWKEMKDRSLF
ncbi:hypothetical protein CJF32_00006848 [Rutstroemia sp. NJR-2017a WRK4]|nr:hypothetical protein CJF32_00006848 [Rutstroemia sp. NJR-2017a WRK4]